MNSPSEKESLPFYDDNAAAYILSTKDLDLSELYNQFLPHIPAGGLILDAGCGSGRDSRQFAQRGFQVEAIDASPRMVAAAGQYPGVQAKVQRLQDITTANHYDGIWACASLVHFPLEEIPSVLQRLINALKPDGILFASFKHGAGQLVDAHRTFTIVNEESLASICSELSATQTIRTWVTTDLFSNNRVMWLNALQVKKSV